MLMLVIQSCIANKLQYLLMFLCVALSHSTRFAYPYKDTEFGVYKCTGSESSIIDCPPDTVHSGFSSCDHWRVSVDCSNLNGKYHQYSMCLHECLIFHFHCIITETENCTTENSLRLVDGPSDSEGQLQICRNSRWTDVCSSTSYLYNLGSIACRQLGYTSPCKLEIYNYTVFDLMIQ